MRRKSGSCEAEACRSSSLAWMRWLQATGKSAACRLPPNPQPRFVQPTRSFWLWELRRDGATVLPISRTCMTPRAELPPKSRAILLSSSNRPFRSGPTTRWTPSFASCDPEFLREGAAIEDFKRPDRIVIGTDDERARRVMRELYRPLFINETPILFTGRRSAELIKYASNAFLATKITFINEMADLCEKCGADVQEVARGMGLDRRIAGKFLHAGPGFGGSCFPKDIAALSVIGQRYGAPIRIVETVMGVNDARKRAMAAKVVAACGGSLAGKTVAVLGLTFKPNTDDMREAPSLVIVPALEAQGARVRAYDPHGMEEARKLMPRLETAADPYACIEGADAMLILTEWDQFRALDLDRVKKAPRSPVIVDLRNIYRPADLAAKGLTYVSVGRG